MVAEDDEVTGIVCDSEVRELLVSCDVEDDVTIGETSATTEDKELIDVCPFVTDVSALELSDVDDD